MRFGCSLHSTLRKIRTLTHTHTTRIQRTQCKQRQKRLVSSARISNESKQKIRARGRQCDKFINEMRTLKHVQQQRHKNIYTEKMKTKDDIISSKTFNLWFRSTRQISHQSTTVIVTTMYADSSTFYSFQMNVSEHRIYVRKCCYAYAHRTRTSSLRPLASTVDCDHGHIAKAHTRPYTRTNVNNFFIVMLNGLTCDVCKIRDRAGIGSPTHERPHRLRTHLHRITMCWSRVRPIAISQFNTSTWPTKWCCRPGIQKKPFLPRFAKRIGRAYSVLNFFSFECRRCQWTHLVCVLRKRVNLALKSCVATASTTRTICDLFRCNRWNDISYFSYLKNVCALSSTNMRPRTPSIRFDDSNLI